MAEPVLSMEKMKRFYKALAVAARRMEERKLARKLFEEQLKRVKRIVSIGIPQKELKKELERLEERLVEIVRKEGLLLTAQELGQREIEERLAALERKLSAISERDLKRIEQLQRNVLALENELKKREQIHGKEMLKRSESIKEGIISIKGRINELIRARKIREQRLAELERKIRESIQGNYVELLKIERELSDIDERLEALASKGIAVSFIQKLKAKIVAFKQALAKKKRALAPKLPVPAERYEEAMLKKHAEEEPKKEAKEREEKSAALKERETKKQVEFEKAEKKLSEFLLPKLPKLPEPRFFKPLEKEKKKQEKNKTKKTKAEKRIRHEMRFSVEHPLPPLRKKRQYKELELFKLRRPKQGLFRRLTLEFKKLLRLFRKSK